MFKNNTIKAIIFDWGRTLFDSENKTEFPESETVLQYCQEKGYKLAVVSLVTPVANATFPERKAQIENSPLRNYFDIALVTDQDKDKLFDQVIREWGGLPRENILIVDDRTVRGIKYGNKRGHSTVWLKKGKFANELPNPETGQPNYTIHSLLELKNLL